MRASRFGTLLALLRQGLAVELEFGTHSLEALLGVAETVERSVLDPDSLVRTAEGLEFTLANPPLRLGAFHAARVLLDGAAVPSDRLRLRVGEPGPWRTATSLSEVAPLVLLPGVPTRFAVDGARPAAGRRLAVRLELESVAIPPKVWVEFEAEPGEAGRG